MKEASRRPVQDKFTANLWIDEIVRLTKKKGFSGTYAYHGFVEKMVKEKMRIELWQLEKIGNEFQFKPAWASMKFELILKEYK